MNFKALALATSFVTLGTSALAGTISISSFSVGDYNSALSTFDRVVGEDFESATVGNVDNGFVTNVGEFSTLGGTGSGGTVNNVTFNGVANDGSKLAVRDGYVYGRTSTTAALTGNASDDQFLDSNDTWGIRWDVKLADGSMFNKLILTLTDAADVGARMLVSSAGLASETLETAGNANQQLIVINFDEYVSEATVLFENRGGNGNLTNDGFSVDDFAASATPVPLPAGFLLLGTAIGGLSFAKRRKQS